MTQDLEFLQRPGVGANDETIRNAMGFLASRMARRTRKRKRRSDAGRREGGVAESARDCKDGVG